jgi:hypothetical protein
MQLSIGTGFTQALYVTGNGLENLVEYKTHGAAGNDNATFTSSLGSGDQVFPILIAFDASSGATTITATGGSQLLTGVAPIPRRGSIIIPVTP